MTGSMLRDCLKNAALAKCEPTAECLSALHVLGFAPGLPSYLRRREPLQARSGVALLLPAAGVHGRSGF